MIQPKRTQDLRPPAGGRAVRSPKCVRIEWEFDDGVVEYATGDHAEEVMAYINGAQVMAAIHGSQYRGRKMLRAGGGGGADERH